MFLETPHLLIQKPSKDEVDRVVALNADPAVMRYIYMGMPRVKEDTLKLMQKNANHWEQFGYGFCSIYEKSSKEFVGRAGLLHLAYQADQPEVELGYVLHQKFWGRGYATEIARAFLKWAFENLDKEYILGVTYKENIGSQKVLKKVGMQFDREDFYPGTNFKSLFFKVTPESAIL